MIKLHIILSEAKKCFAKNVGYMWGKTVFEISSVKLGIGKMGAEKVYTLFSLSRNKDWDTEFVGLSNGGCAYLAYK